ncbi:hypothetical protein Q9252_16325 [Marinobacter salarius]|uniref:hypothetical protein n=1 Tax=Marinobacter salarius TaxID=1420917 RepID=UPI00273C1E52|nr:hypothetical protein [Marinobacter salarius]MDP4533711.1 hypothetical protein [Marinobacter salarius]
MRSDTAYSGFTERSGLIFVTDSYEDLRLFKPEKVILSLSKTNAKFDVGSLCYKLVKRQPGSIVYLVDEDSLDDSRRQAVSELVSYFKAKDSTTSDRPALLGIRAFQRWMDTQKLEIDFASIESVKQRYSDYTRHLIYRKNLPKSPENRGLALKNNHASTLQKRARIWCHCITGVPLSEIEFWSPRILFNDREKAIPDPNPITLDDCDKTCSALVQIIDDAWTALVKSDQDYFRIGHHWVDLTSRTDTKQLLLSRITSFAAMSLIAVSGTNKEVACKLEIGKGEYSSTTKGMKYTGLKARANNKTVKVEFGARYLKYWKKYLELRELVLEGEHSKYVFPYRTHQNSIVSLPPRRLDSDREGKLPSSFFEDITDERWITARRWRPARSLRINQINGGDIIETADMQNHTIGVARKHYLKVDLATAAAEISSALNAVYDAAIRRTRYRESIAVDVVDEYDKNRKIPVGQCSSDNTLDPQLAPGFTDQNPVPDCRAKETCIFCDHYSVHADEQDLRRLLSLRFLCEELKGSMGHDEYVEQWGPVLYRVDEIIEAVLKESPNLKAQFESVKSEVDLGYLDRFWASHLETLMAVGVIS